MGVSREKVPEICVGTRSIRDKVSHKERGSVTRQKGRQTERKGERKEKELRVALSTARTEQKPDREASSSLRFVSFELCMHSCHPTAADGFHIAR